MTYGATPSSNNIAIELIRKKSINVKDMITHRLPLEEIDHGFKIANGLENCLKVIIEPNSKK